MQARLRRVLMVLALMISFATANAGQNDQAMPREVLINGVEFVYVPEGWFWYPVENGRRMMTSRPEKFLRQVNIWLDGYYIAKFEARARDLKGFLEKSATPYASRYKDGEKDGCALRRNESGEYYLMKPELDLPATHMSWRLADELAKWMGFRLPTEAEWVKAARGTDKRIWPWGDEHPDDTFAAYGGGAACNPSPVGSYVKGRSPYGAYDMAGNIFEYVADWFNAEFDAGLKDGMRNPKLAESGTPVAGETHGNIEPQKLLKGGRWASGPEGIAVLERFTSAPDGDGFNCFGTRFALDLAVVREHLDKGSARVLVQ